MGNYLSFLCPACGVDLVVLVDELAIQRWELDQPGRAPLEVAYHLQVQCAQLSEKSKEMRSIEQVGGCNLRAVNLLTRRMQVLTPPWGGARGGFRASSLSSELNTAIFSFLISSKFLTPFRSAQSCLHKNCSNI